MTSSCSIIVLTASDLFDIIEINGVLDWTRDGLFNDLRENIRNGLTNVLIDAVLNILIRILLNEIAKAVIAAHTLSCISEAVSAIVLLVFAAPAAIALLHFLIVINFACAALVKAVLFTFGFLLAINSGRSQPAIDSPAEVVSAASVGLRVWARVSRGVSHSARLEDHSGNNCLGDRGTVA